MTTRDETKARVGFCRNAARRLLKEHGVTDPGTPVEGLVEAAGYRIVERDWAPSISGILLREHRVIGVNKNHPEVRRRFTVSHELGHHHLNHHLWFEELEEVTIDNPPVEGCGRSDQTPEREANVFASELLVPLSLLKRAASRGKTPRELAALFRVSEQTMFYALQDHRLLNKL